jgi:predicted DNA binding CopG/RHH family protein
MRMAKNTALMASKKKQIPKFRSEEDERKFWAKNDSAELADWQSGQRRKFPKLKPSLRTISLRLPVWMIEDLKILANERDVPYRSLLKVFLAERLEKERRPCSSSLASRCSK